ncbi:hypothetical protein HELRODRAFT_158999 [Helobdella robusta]|uniref:Uncharacterized protein n=1 Tax=Helobdella robusta TaxID=6412 RepID=T1ENH0_HELRO|nr:hypothetical protein HELRODRAFT_158999 [Helobdella robusta]ESO12465.1 hypothetical protein HELRODRAFT_158999 [Helobdella robusta]
MNSLLKLPDVMILHRYSKRNNKKFEEIIPQLIVQNQPLANRFYDVDNKPKKETLSVSERRMKKTEMLTLETCVTEVSDMLNCSSEILRVSKTQDVFDVGEFRTPCTLIFMGHLNKFPHDTYK